MFFFFLLYNFFFRNAKMFIELSCQRNSIFKNLYDHLKQINFSLSQQFQEWCSNMFFEFLTFNVKFPIIQNKIAG
jgi:hypothetical protein